MKSLANSSCARVLLIPFVLGAAFAQAPAGNWFTVRRGSMCVTEGAIVETAGDRLQVNVPKMRAYVNTWTSQSIELRFTYRGPTQKKVALGSGEMRQQFGLKLRAQDACNLVYAMWRVEPESKLVVSVKRNPSAHTSAACGERGYENIAPRRASDLPRLRPGESHTLRAEMKKEELQVFVDDREVWVGDVGQGAAKIEGPVGIRSDNARLEFELKAGEYVGVHPNFVLPCQSAPGPTPLSRRPY
jgi:hypothetical protein